MPNTNEQETQVTQAEYVLSEIEEMEIISHIKTQQIQNRISRDGMNLEKIDVLAGLLNLKVLDGVGEMVVTKKIEQLVKRL